MEPWPSWVEKGCPRPVLPLGRGSQPDHGRAVWAMGSGLADCCHPVVFVEEGFSMAWGSWCGCFSEHTQTHTHAHTHTHTHTHTHFENRETRTKQEKRWK